jgi:hypothetical protein
MQMPSLHLSGETEEDHVAGVLAKTKPSVSRTQVYTSRFLSLFSYCRLMLFPCCASVNFPTLLTAECLIQCSWYLIRTYIMAPEPASTAYFTNPSHQSVYVSHQSLLGNGSVKTFPWQRRIVGVFFYSVRVFRRKVGHQFSELLVMYFH